MVKKSIIIIDDNIISLKIAIDSLKNDYQVFSAVSGEKLFVLLEMFIPDLILLDIQMPGMNGFEVIERIKAKPITAKIPIIVVTSSNSLEYEKQCYYLDVCDFIHKPYFPAFLNKRVGIHLENQFLKKQNIQNEENINFKQNDLLDFQMSTLKGIIESLERRIELSGGHVERTRKYVETLIDMMQKNNIYGDIISTWKKDLILPSTMLYDLGKLSIRDTILMKPDKLEADEYKAIKAHASMGMKLIDDIRSGMRENSTEADILNYAKEFAGYHHEKWDGTGYPNGLKGYNIPLPGRLMAIADVYDALISKRVYKESLTPEQAVKIITQGKGTHFDPALVDVFMSVSDEFSKIAGYQIPLSQAL